MLTCLSHEKQEVTRVFITHLRHTPTFEDAIRQISKGQECILSRIPLIEVFARTACLRALASDFDGTLVLKNQWLALQAHLPDELRAVEEKNREWYLRQTHGKRTIPTSLADTDWFHGNLLPKNQLAAEGAWIASSVSHFREGRITRRCVHEVGRTLTPRPGAIALLRLFDPRVIVSLGIEQIIHGWLEAIETHAAVAATRLTFDEQDVVSGCRINVVGSRTKKEAVGLFREITGISTEQLLVVGDAVVDVHMMHPKGVNVLIVPPSEADKKLRDFRDNHLAEMWERLTFILVSDHLEPIVSLIKEARASIPAVD